MALTLSRSACVSSLCCSCIDLMSSGATGGMVPTNKSNNQSNHPIQPISRWREQGNKWDIRQYIRGAPKDAAETYPRGMGGCTVSTSSGGASVGARFRSTHSSACRLHSLSSTATITFCSLCWCWWSPCRPSPWCGAGAAIVVGRSSPPAVRRCAARC